MSGALGQAISGGEDKVQVASSSRSTPASAGNEHLNNRAPVLFSSRHTFSSKSAFFIACKAANLVEYGYTTHQLSNNQTTVVACCAGRRHEHCKMQVAAFMCDDDRWMVDSERCTWAHAHAPDEVEMRAQAEAREQGEEDEEAPARKPGAGPSRITAREPVDEADAASSDETDGSGELSSDESSGDEYGRSRTRAAGRAGSSSDEEDEEDEDSEEEPAGSTSRAVAQLPMPKLPAVGDTFPSAAAFEAACVVAVIRVYGYSVSKAGLSDVYFRVRCNYHQTKPDRCPFALVARKDLDTGRWVVRDTAGPRLHSHGRHPQIVRDSMWLPTVVCETARAALGLAPGKRARDKARREERARRKGKDKAEKERPPPQRQRTSRPSLPPAGSTSTPRSAFAFTPPARPPSSSPFAHASTAAPSHVSPQPSPATVQRSSPHRSSTGTPLVSSASASSPHAPASPFLADLAAFLLRLDPALEHLAPTLFAAGISTETDLVSLRELGRSHRTAMYGELRRRGWVLSGEDEERLERGLGGA
ncbi:hypothetical protein JCM8208_007215 [Rhodotorula glutinis]